MSDGSDLRLKVLVVSRQTAALDVVEGMLKKRPGIDLRRKLIVNGHADPLEGVQELPDALILHVGERWQAELESLSARAADRRPPLVVLGSASDASLMRLAMQAGARDLLNLPVVPDELVAALERIERDHRAKAPVEARVTAFINAKGGCGATLLACSVAHILAAASQKRVALFDLDLQFGAIPLYFDLRPKRGILQALENIDGVDELALDGYMVRHESGLKILGQAEDDPLDLRARPVRQIGQLLDVAVRAHEHLIIDLPRRIDEVAIEVFERARQIVMVVQQSVTTVRDASRLIQCLRRDLMIGKDRIVVVVNRYDADLPITADDIRNTLQCGELALVPNDFRTVSECINTGTPLLKHSRGSAIARALMSLETRLGGTAASERRGGLLERTFSSFRKSRSA